MVFPTQLIFLQLLELFIEEFFDQNPISQLGVIVMHNKRAEKISELAGNFRKHLKAVSGLNRTSLIGEPSLQNGLELSLKSLKLLPTHASREILVIMGSLTTCDPSDIHITIDVSKINYLPSDFILLYIIFTFNFDFKLFYSNLNQKA